MPQKLIILVIAIALLTGLVAAADITAKEGGDLYVDGDLGVGNTNPAKLLHVGDGTTGAEMRLNGFAGTSNNYDFTTSGGNFLNISSGKAGASALILDSDGNVGMGTASPNAMLHIEGGDTSDDEFIRLGYNSLNFHFINGNFHGSSLTDNWLDFHISTGSGGQNVTVMRLEGTGNVGIGVTSPTAQLSLGGTNQMDSGDAADKLLLYGGKIGAGTQGANIELYGGQHALANKTYYDADLHTFRAEDGSPTTMTIDPITNGVGIGTASPDQKLKVSGNANITGTVYYGALQANSPHFLDIDPDVGYTRICIIDKGGFSNLIYWEDGVIKTEKDNSVCNAKREKILATRVCYNSNMLFDESDMSCYDYPEEEE